MKFSLSDQVYPILLSLFFVLILTQIPMDRMDSFFYDKWVQIDSYLTSYRLENIVVVEVNEESDNFLGEKYPYSYATFSKAIKNLTKESPSAIGLNLSQPIPANNDEYFQLKRYYEIIQAYTESGGDFKFGTIISTKGEQLPPLELKNLDYLPSILVENDDPFSGNLAMRSAVLSIQGEKTFQLWLAESLWKKQRSSKMGQEDIPYRRYISELDAVTVLLKYPDINTNTKNLNSIPFHRLVVGDYDQDFFKNKLVIVGPSYDATERQILTSHTPSMHKYRIPLFVNISIALGLSKSGGVKLLSPMISYFLCLFLTFYLSVMTLKINPLIGLRNIVVLISFLLVVSFLSFYLIGIWLNISHILLSCFIVYYVCLPIRAISEHRSKSEIQNKAKIQKEIDHLKHNFVSLMGHDLRTPVAKIKGILEMVSGKMTSGDGQKADLKHALTAVDELNNFINSILEVSQLDDTRMKLTKKSKDINMLLKDIIEECRYHAHKKDIQLITHFEPLFPIEIDVDLIKRVFVNLIENAIKYGNKGGQVQLFSKEEGDWVIIEVVDNGPGIPEENTPFIFEKFYRVKNDANHSIKGSGLGLYLVKFFIELHEGDIHVTGNSDGGATFIVKLPNN